jgi:DNA-binding Xre family transcriptional regulator
VRNVLGRLRNLVNEEMIENDLTIKEFSLRCGISYNEMRNIANGQAIDIKVSTIEKICENSHIEMWDIFDDGVIEFERLFNRLILLYKSERYSLTLNKYR